MEKNPRTIFSEVIKVTGKGAFSTTNTHAPGPRGNPCFNLRDAAAHNILRHQGDIDDGATVSLCQLICWHDSDIVLQVLRLGMLLGWDCGT